MKPDANSHARLDIHESPDSNQITATFELPGLKKSDVNIDVQDGRLVVSGQTAVDTEKKDEGYHLRERRFGRFSRTIPLPRGVKPEEIAAKMEDGVLSVVFPKTGAEQTPKKITIS